MLTLKKFDLNGCDYLDPTTLIDEQDKKSFEIYSIAKCICDVLNYYQENSPDAFGNAEYQRICGFMDGYLCGMKLTLERTETNWIVSKGKRKILSIEVPKKPDSYYICKMSENNIFTL